jgi:hypothetical protein
VVTYRLEGSHLALAGGDVIDGDASVSLRGEPVVEQEAVGNLGHTLVAPVLSSEVEIGCPVVAEIVGRATSRARRHLRDVGHRHRDVEGVAAHNLVHVGCGHPARFDERVESFDGNLGASEPKMIQSVQKPLGIGEAREDKGGPQHGGSGSVDRCGW